MEIIVKLNAVDMIQNDIVNVSDETYQDIFKKLSDAYIDGAADKEAYLSPCWDKDNFLFGRERPDELINRAKGWNGEIQAQFLRLVDEVCHISVTGKLPEAGTLEMDTILTYQLASAAREIDNHWYDFAEHAVYMENEQGYPYFKVILEDSDLADIEKHPEEYFIVGVFPK